MRKGSKYPNKKQPSGYKWLSHREFVAIEDLLKECVGRESVNDLRVYNDIAIAAMINEMGIPISQEDVCHHRYKLGIPGGPTRLRNLLKMRATNGKMETNRT